MGERVQCAWCKDFERGSGAPEALGRCGGGMAWDGQAGQWPFQRHPCQRFRDMGFRPGEDESVAVKDLKFYIKELRSDGCLCGSKKTPGHSFCYRCYKRLPAEMKTALYKSMGAGYEEAYEAAAEYLDDERN